MSPPLRQETPMTTTDAGRGVAPTLFEVQRPFSPVQWAAVAGSLLILAWSVPGLIVNPDFATGDAASAERVLGVDMNGWHAVSGFLIAVPGLMLATRPHLLARFLPLAAGSLIATGVWALFSTTLAGGLFYFPNNGADALLHFATSAIFIAGAAHYFLRGRAPTR
jgi:Domain of unknown function (DUF4383)